MIQCFLISFFLPTVFLASATPNNSAGSLAEKLKDGLVKPAVNDPLINELVTYKPIKDHHFNLEAPQECGDKSTIDPTARQITCQFHDSGKRQVRLSVCDNAKKYCRQELIDVAVRVKKSGTPRIKIAPQAETIKMQNKTKKLLMASFKSMSPDEARQAASTKTAVLAMVSTDWCPPCNMAKEFLLPTKKFKETTKDMLLVYVDGDSPASDAWKPFLKSRFYPTFIVLNKNLESVALFSDIGTAKNTEKITAGLNTLNDTYADLEARVAARLSGSFLQKTKDLFTSTEQVEADQERLLKYLSARAKYKEEAELMQKISPEKYKNKILYAELEEHFNVDKDASDEENKTKKQNLSKALLDLPVSEDSESYYPYLAMDFCSSSKKEETDKPTSDCKSYIAKASKHLDQSKTKNWEKYNDAEKIISRARTHNLQAMLHEAIDSKELTKKHYANCYKTYNELYIQSPLKEKSRSVRLQQLYCLKGDDNSDETLKLLSSLVKDYPFEETFQRKLASYYLKKKNFKKAQKYNEQAVKFSYGAMWALNMSSKAKIEQGLKKDSDALNTLNVALEELVLEKESRSSWTIKMLRGQYEALKTKLEKKKI